VNHSRYFFIFIITVGFTDSSAQGENRFVNVSGKKQHIRVSGIGKPTIIFVTGLAEPLTNYDSIQKVFSNVTETFSYDRAGLGKSEPISVERSIDNLAKS
jgi:hypothetical protein